MHFTNSGALSAKATPNHGWKRHLKIEKIAYYTMKLYSDAAIACAMGISAGTISSIKKTQEYHAKMMELKTGIVSELDKDIRSSEEYQRLELASMVPAALLNLRQKIVSANENVSLKASLEILDREGNLGKVSRHVIEDDRAPDLTKANTIASDIMSLLGGTPHRLEQAVNEATGFTLTAAEATIQVKVMGEKINEQTLEELDVATKSVQ